MKLNKTQLQFLLDFANNANGSDIKYFIFDKNENLCGVAEDAPLMIKEIYENYKRLQKVGD